MEALATRGIAAAGVVLALVIGGWTGSRLTLQTQDAVELALAKRVSPEDAQRQALQEDASYEDSEEFYKLRIEEAVSKHGVTAPSMDRLREPNLFVEVASPGDTKTIAPNETLTEAGLSISAGLEEVEVERRGVRTKAMRTMARVANVGDTPLAYFLTMEVSGGCKVRSINRYDVMVLLPQEEAELSLCAGEHDVVVTALKIMEVTELGALWVSKVPPQAVGHDADISRAHVPGPGIEMCAEIPAVDFAGRIERGEAAWEDIVDFYSRHDCEASRWWPGYRRIIEPLKRLPAVAPS